MMAKVTVEQNETIVAKAATFAIRAHEGQIRKGTGFPFVVHPVGVAHILRDYYPDDEHLEAAGYLHDVLEDTSYTFEDLVAMFNPDIAYLVEGVTNDGEWSLSDYVDEPRVLRLKAADMIDNILDTVRGLEKGHDVWSRFAAGKRKAKTWRKHTNLIRTYMPYEHLGDLALVSKLEAVLTRAESLQ